MTTPSRTLLGPVRISLGMTQHELERLSGVSQGVISGLESARIRMSDELAGLLSRALGSAAELLQSPAPAPVVVQPLQKSLPARPVKKIVAELTLSHFHVGRLLGPPHAAVSRLPDGALPDDHARALRRAWNVPSGPIGDMIALLESHGITCLIRDTAAVRSDVVGSWTSGERPVVFIGARTPPREARAALARELGRAVLSNNSAAASEHDAEAFASGLLLPPEDVVWTRAGHLDWSRLGDLEDQWGVPAAMILTRALHTRVISATRYRELKRIVLDIGSAADAARVEQPTALREAVRQRVAAGESHMQIAESALLDVAQLQKDYLQSR